MTTAASFAVQIQANGGRVGSRVLATENVASNGAILMQNTKRGVIAIISVNAPTMKPTKRDLEMFRKAMFAADTMAAKTGKSRLRAIKTGKRRKKQLTVV